MKTDDLRATLKLIAEEAPGLREAGVESFAVGDIHVELTPRDLPEAAPSKATSDEKTTDAPLRGDPSLDDTITYGGRRVPGRQRHEEPRDA